ncbi:MAG TPA: efflux RND transporter periplasmic adaptor subunit [Candidatus Lustribacter sp.]
MHRWTWFAGGAVVVAAVAAFVLFHRGAPATAPAGAAPAVDLATVRYAPYAVVLDESGTAGPPAGSTSQLSFPNPGILAEVNVRVGEQVSAGQPLASLRARPLALAAQQAAADAASARAQARAAAVDKYSTQVAVDRAALSRAQKLYVAGVDAQKDVQAAQAQLASDEASSQGASADRVAAAAQARSADAKAQLAQTDLAYATLRAPADGVVTAILRRPGEAVDPSTPVIAIGPPVQGEVTLHVPAADAAQMRVGDSAAVRSSESNATAQGRVTAVVPALETATQSATVVVDAVPRGAVAGAAVRARITVARVRGFVVPVSAIVSDPQNGDDVIFAREKQKDGTYRFAEHTVTIAHQDAASALLSSGVHAGEQIAAQGAFQLLAPAGGD